jgi:hypothetical protein
MQRTSQQNAALHLYFELVAQALNNADYGVQTVLKKTVGYHLLSRKIY